MLKERLYYKDSYCKSFTTQISKAVQDENGNPYVILENTAFYPTGGGQPHDTGTLNGISVLNVEEVDGEIRHYLAKSLEFAKQVEGVVNWERRFDHMQQHAGQHILSAAFIERFDFSTVSFHLGTDSVSIDLDTENISPGQLETIEKTANKIILENRPIESIWVTENELSKYPLHKEIVATGEIRLVIIPDYDFNGCGGTHPSTTGQVNALKILSTEKHRAKTRVHFVCGNRVLKQLHRKTNILTDASRSLSAPEDGVNTAIQNLLETNHSLEKELQEAQEILLTFEAKALLDSQQGIIKAVFTGRTVQQLQKLARLLIAESDEVIVLFVTENEDRLQFVAARGASIETDMKQISTAALPVINGKGGGSDAFVQGGGERTVTAEELLQTMVALC